MRPATSCLLLLAITLEVWKPYSESDGEWKEAGSKDWLLRHPLRPAAILRLHRAEPPTASAAERDVVRASLIGAL